jgi:membrane protein
LELSRTSVQAFIDDEGLTRGAAIAFYTIMSIGPVLFIVVAIAGLAFGEDAARGAISGQLSGLMGQQSADSLRSAASNSAGFLAAATGIVTLVITASGVFSEMQQSLNVIWRMTPRGTTVARVIRARAASSWYPSLSAPWSQPSVSTSTLTCRSATWSFGSGLQEIGILASS